MSELSEEFKKVVFKKQLPNEKLVVPLLRWLSGSHKNIEKMQRVNLHFLHVNRKINISELTLNNTVTHFLKYPPKQSIDKKLKFFYSDIAHYYGWTTNELRKNLPVLNIDSLKEPIATAFGYDDKKRKQLNLPTIKEVIKNVKKNKQQEPA